MTDADLDASGAPIFFLSYARSRKASDSAGMLDEFVVRVFHDLIVDLAQLLPVLPGNDVGFMDTRLDGGELWERQLLQAVGTCQVFIPLLSTQYVASSQWCAMEWDLFSRRRAVSRTGSESAAESIVPILWTPLRESIPRPVSSVNLFVPGNIKGKDTYRSNGLLGLIKIGDLDSYGTVIWALARHIAQLYVERRVAPNIENTVDGLPTRFAEVPE
jgi:hypothetical protein